MPKAGIQDSGLFLAAVGWIFIGSSTWSRKLLFSLKIAVWAHTPYARESTATTVNPGLLRRKCSPYRVSSN